MKTNYRNYNKPAIKAQEEIVEESELEIEEVVEEEITEEPELEIEEEVKEEPEKLLMGKVNCKALYVRQSPSQEAAPVGTIKQDQQVMIVESESTETFYSICTENGLEGFCMKQFIAVQ